MTHHRRGLRRLLKDDDLLAAVEGRVLGCGLSGPAEPELAEMYAEAFNR